MKDVSVEAEIKQTGGAENNQSRKYSPLTWVAIAAAIAIEDYVTDPFIQFPILFLIPIVLATIYNGKNWGLAFAGTLPLIRLFLEFHSNAGSEAQEAVNTAIDMIVFIGSVILIDTITKQRRQLAQEVQVLRGLLPICSHCKRIRDESDRWEQLEKYISEHSEARFSHSLCPECIEQHYSKFSGKGRNS